MRFTHHKINTMGNHLVGTSWKFRGCSVTMRDDGFECDCKKQLTYVCNHIKSIQLGLLGVGQTHWK